MGRWGLARGGASWMEGQPGAQDLLGQGLQEALHCADAAIEGEVLHFLDQRRPA